MKLYLITQTERSSYDTYDSAVVVAESEEEARRIYPGEIREYWDKDSSYCDKDCFYIYASWASSPENVTVKYLGEVGKDCVLESKVVCASFNAG